MSEVRRHQRKTATGKTVSVRHHTREGDRGQPEPKMTPREKWQFANEDPDSEDFGKSRADWLASKRERAATHVSSLPQAEPARDEGWWDDDEPEPQAQEWWAEDGLPPPGEFWDEDDSGEDGAHLHPDWAAVGDIKVNRAPAYRPQGDYDFRDD